MHTEVHVYDLLDAETDLRLLSRPRVIAMETTPEWIMVIDEIQKLAHLLIEVCCLIESRSQRLLLTGSSNRKLRRDCTNLL